ncbi:2152_t:CDS:1 [Acaulospora colombiana]|uniref:2152_t:CDS:1 n=1 Tax=Acaulospora colombiana TaxID=27376 RepID=A0ACA9MH30_9GLOM|nr:2152_t:CDS:1 [Acaulospora colombiana]
MSGWIDGRDLSSPEDVSYSVTSVPYKFKLLYRGSRHGFNDKMFHKRCDNKGPTITVIKLEGLEGVVIGGYNPLNWQSPWIRKFEECHHSFVFSICADSLKKNHPKDNSSSGADGNYGVDQNTNGALDVEPTMDYVNKNMIVSTTPAKSKSVFSRATFPKYAINLHRSTGPAFGTTDLVIKDRVLKCKPDCYTLDLFDSVLNDHDHAKKNTFGRSRFLKRSHEDLGNHDHNVNDVSNHFRNVNSGSDEECHDENVKSYLEFDEAKAEDSEPKPYHFKIEEYEVYGMIVKPIKLM